MGSVKWVGRLLFASFYDTQYTKYSISVAPPRIWNSYEDLGAGSWTASCRTWHHDDGGGAVDVRRLHPWDGIYRRFKRILIVTFSISGGVWMRHVCSLWHLRQCWLAEMRSCVGRREAWKPQSRLPQSRGSTRGFVLYQIMTISSIRCPF